MRITPVFVLCLALLAMVDDLALLPVLKGVAGQGHAGRF